MKNLTTIIDNVATLTSESKKTIGSILEAAIAAIHQGLSEGEEVRINNLGTFGITERAARVGRNPATGASIQIPASKGIKFKPAKTLKEAL